MRCEICGKEIRGKPVKILIDRAELIVCRECAKHGTPIIETGATKKKSVLKKERQKPKRELRPLPFEELEIVEDFNTKIKDKREALGLSLSELAKTIKEKESLLRKIEAGKMVPTFDVARKLEKVLGVKILVKETFDGVSGITEKEGKELTLGDIIEFKKKKTKYAK
ncbi:MAG: multiprotein bridging factor aMBF1 [Candidatus Asgardarchaeia archaeon]